MDAHFREYLTSALVGRIQWSLYAGRFTPGERAPGTSTKLKAKLLLGFINWALRHEGVLGSGCIAPPFLTSALHGGERWASRPGCFLPPFRYPLIRVLDGPQGRSGGCGEEKILALKGDWSPAVEPIARRYTDWAIPTPTNTKVKVEYYSMTTYGFVDI
jgi:hypothetical protein